MEENELNLYQTILRKNIPVLISGLLWVVSAFLALAGIFALHDYLIWGLAFILVPPGAVHSFQASRTINVVNDCSAMLLGVLSIAVIIISGEYFFAHAGQPRLLRILTGLIVVECIIVIPAALLFWRV